MAKSGYIEKDEKDEKPQQRQGLSSAEQELCINAMRNDEHAIVYVTDTTYMTKLDKLCESSPEYYSLVANNGIGKTYMVKDKSLISFRQKKREMSEEAKAAASERFKGLHAEGKIKRGKKNE